MKIKQAIATTLRTPNNEQKKHLSQAFRIAGVAGFLGVATKYDSTFFEIILLFIGWVVFEACAMVALSFIKEEN